MAELWSLRSIPSCNQIQIQCHPIRMIQYPHIPIMGLPGTVEIHSMASLAGGCLYRWMWDSHQGCSYNVVDSMAAALL